MTRNQARAPLLAESFPTVPSTRPGDTRSGRSHRDKQNKIKQNKQNKQPSLIERFWLANYCRLCVYDKASQRRSSPPPPPPPLNPRLRRYTRRISSSHPAQKSLRGLSRRRLHCHVHRHGPLAARLHQKLHHIAIIQGAIVRDG